MIKDMIVSSTALETRVAILEDDQLAELYIERHGNRGILANTYKGKVTKVLPGMQSAFVNIGLEKDAFLYVSDFIEESEECETVFPAPEEPAEAAPAPEPEAAERPGRRERRGERGRWRDRKERSEARREPEAAETPSEPPLEQWNISAETEREVEAHFESDVLSGGGGTESSADPVEGAPGEGQPASAEAPEGEAPAEHRAATGAPAPPGPDSLGIAAIATTVCRLPLMRARRHQRQGTGTLRKRYTARVVPTGPNSSIDDMLTGAGSAGPGGQGTVGRRAGHCAYAFGPYLVYIPTVEHIGVSRSGRTPNGSG